MLKSKYTLGKNLKMWAPAAQTISFIVTEDCNLRCKYCYITHKASNKVMELSTAQRFIDYLFSDAIHRQEAVSIEFIGGEPCIEMSLIDKICDYFKLKAYEVGSDWYWNYRISICTNGVNYSSEEVQSFITKNKGKLSMTISIDGTQEKHDSQRVFPNGSGSYDIIKKSLPLYISQFGGHTKATFARDDLLTLKDSIISLWDSGITEVAANVIFEDVWQEGDDILFENQLKALADYALEHHLFDKYMCTFFDDSIGYYYNREDLGKTWCGAGKMLALGPNGNIYPCVRYKDYSLNKQPERTFGNIFDGGIDMDLVRPFITSTISLQSDNECLNCSVAVGCAFCQGFNYDEAEIPTNFHRAKYICKMHKARVRANDYYFSQLYNRFGIKKEVAGRQSRKLYFLLADDYVPYCQYMNDSQMKAEVRHMGDGDIIKGLAFARRNMMMPVFVHSKSTYAFKDISLYGDYFIQHIIPIKFYEESASLHRSRECIFVFEKDDCELPISGLACCQLNIDAHDIKHLFSYIKLLLQKSIRININIMGLDRKFDEEEYQIQLHNIVDYLFLLDKQGEVHQINIIDDTFQEVSKVLPEHFGCRAGDRSFIYAVDGLLYTCPYFLDMKDCIGPLSGGLEQFKLSRLYKIESKPLCATCDAFQCSMCIAINEKYTKELNVPPSFQCRKSMIEKDAVMYYQKLKGLSTKLLPPQDPIASILKGNQEQVGIYKI